jgi:hypothetical protein
VARPKRSTRPAGIESRRPGMGTSPLSPSRETGYAGRQEDRPTSVGGSLASGLSRPTESRGIGVPPVSALLGRLGAVMRQTRPGSGFYAARRSRCVRAVGTIRSSRAFPIGSMTRSEPCVGQDFEEVRPVESLDVLGALGAPGGGFVVPYELDPSILISSAGVPDPMREVARVERTAQNEECSAPASGARRAGSGVRRVSDDTPTLLQPWSRAKGPRRLCL